MKTVTTTQYTEGTKKLSKVSMARFQDIMPYVVLGSVVGVFFLYVVLTVHYSANIAGSQQRLAYELRKMRKMHSSLPAPQKGASVTELNVDRARGRSNNLNLLPPADKTNHTDNTAG